MFQDSRNRSAHFRAGERFRLPVKKLVPNLGAFFEIAEGFDALLHISKVPNGDLSAFKVGQICHVRISFIDPRGRVQLELDHNPPPPAASSTASAAAWRQTHTAEDARAVDWLRGATCNSALHATLLAELKRFGVPTPLSAWVALHSDEFVNFGPKNPVSPHPCVGLVSRLRDWAYWQNPTRVLPQEPMANRAMPAPPSTKWGLAGNTAGMVAESFSRPPQNAAGRNPSLLLVDGSNLVRTLPGAGNALAALLFAFERAGREFNVVFDATIRHVFEEAKDVAGQQLLATCAPRVTIVPAGTPADDYLLLLADRKGCAVVSNDRFEQYRDRYPWLGARVESAERRLHAVAEIGGELVAPTLGLVARI